MFFSVKASLAAVKTAIRPTPTAGTQGGVARRTREAILACEAAGFDVVLVETVGVGQSETAVAEMVDMFLLMLLPGSGDELQGLKRGIVELADLVIVNKADQDLAEAANRVAAEYANAVHLLRPATPYWTARVVTCSALEGTGIGDIWQLVEEYRSAMANQDALEQRRSRQARSWMWREVDESVLASFRAHPAVKSRISELVEQVEAGTLTPTAAAQALLAAFRQGT